MVQSGDKGGMGMMTNCPGCDIKPGHPLHPSQHTKNHTKMMDGESKSAEMKKHSESVMHEKKTG